MCHEIQPEPLSRLRALNRDTVQRMAPALLLVHTVLRGMTSPPSDESQNERRGGNGDQRPSVDMSLEDSTMTATWTLAPPGDRVKVAVIMTTPMDGGQRQSHNVENGSDTSSGKTSIESYSV